MPIHICEAADAAFATRFRQTLSGAPVDHIPRIDYAMDRDLLMLSESDCTWPSPARSRFLLETSFRAVCQCYHIVRRSIARRDLDLALRGGVSHDSFTTCRLWALFALGLLHSTKIPSEAEGHRFPGLAYFAQASRLLRYLSERPGIEYMEVLLLLVGYASCSSHTVLDESIVIVFVSFEPTAYSILPCKLRCTCRGHYGSALEFTRSPLHRPRDKRASQTLVVDSIHL